MNSTNSVPLAEAADLNPRLSALLGDEDEVSFVPMASLSAEDARVVTPINRHYREVKKGYTCFESGDVLVAKITPCFENGKIAQATLPNKIGFGSTEFHVVRPKPGVADGRYLHHFLRRPEVRFAGERRMTGSGGQRRVPEDFFAMLSVPLPSVAEQRRIAATLDQADALRSLRRRTLTELDHLAQSVFVEMFGDAKGLPTLALGDLCSLVTDGTHQTPTYADTGTVFLSAKNVTTGYVDWENVKYIPEELHRELHRRLAPRRGDILLAKNGTTGVAALVDRDCTFDIYVSLALLRPNAATHPLFLLGAINSPLCKRQFDESLKGIGVPNLHLKEIRSTKIPLASQSAQLAYVEQAQAIEALKITHRAALAASDALFASIQHRAFAVAR